MVQHSPFTCKEDSNLHLQAFVQLCQIFNEDGVTQDQMKARHFPFSLHGKPFALVPHSTGGVEARLGSVDEELYEGILYPLNFPHSKFVQQD
jgi:hypothetical protein